MFSVILPVYNGENTLENTILSVINEFIFDDDELIIVNDGSNDGTKEIINSYKNFKHIKMKHKKHNGVSSARNSGINLVSKNSKYILFIDDSDTLSSGYFEKCYSFFKNNKGIKLAATSIIIKEKEFYREHSLNYRFKTNKTIVDILKDINDIQYHIGGMVFDKDYFLKNNYKFDESISYWEDAKLINSIILETRFYGLIKDANYIYSRDNNDSLSKISWFRDERYIKHIQNNYFDLIDKSLGKFGMVISYIQYLIGNHYLEYLRDHNQDNIDLNKIMKNDLFEIESVRLFQFIDKKTILKLNISEKVKALLLSLKSESLDYVDNYKNITTYFHRIDFRSRKLFFSFSDESYGISLDSNVYIKDGDVKTKKSDCISYRPTYILGEEVKDFSRNIYSVKLPVKSIFKDFQFCIFDRDNNIHIEIASNSIIKRIFRLESKIKKEIVKTNSILNGKV